MIKLTQSLRHWLWENHRSIIPLISLGHIELFTPEMEREYIEWCKTDEGKKYLKGGSEYKNDEYNRGIEKTFAEKQETKENVAYLKNENKPTADEQST